MRSAAVIQDSKDSNTSNPPVPKLPRVLLASPEECHSPAPARRSFLGASDLFKFAFHCGKICVRRNPKLYQTTEQCELMTVLIVLVNDCPE